MIHSREADSQVTRNRPEFGKFLVKWARYANEWEEAIQATVFNLQHAT